MDSSVGGSGGAAGGGDGRAQAEQCLEVAEKLLSARDLVGCKRFAERALESNPLLAGADELLAVADVLLASQNTLLSGHADPLAVLQLPPGGSPDQAAVSRAYRRLALLLGPSNQHPGAEMALRLVHDAYALLSDPSRRPPPSAAGTPSQPAAAAADRPEFWTACPFCCYVHQYQRELVGRALKCPNVACRRGFVAAEIPTPPTIVPGTEMYHCAWGFFPLGFPNAADLDSNWKPFYKVFPWNTAPSGEGAGGGSHGKRGGSNSARQPQGVSARGGSSRGRVKKTTARKKVGVGLKRRSFGGGVESGIDSSMLGQEGWAGGEEDGDGQAEEVRGININEAAQTTDGTSRVNVSGSGGVVDMGNFHIDVDATEDILGNLHSIPFLRVDNLGRML
ncbi:uncharacterized protein LOC133912631 [Phragmites australis]|uniref:uncharacterized protein LOC133912631 n=1 Tax=Phragmites australis TaxID=29695 RepID=UPI002D771291|nr:uncharacterized protein LOC133912631 [Phragmites australis]